MKSESNDRKNAKKQTSETSDSNKLSGRNEITESAREEAMDDIEEDAELSSHSPNDDLDEGETARLGEDKTDLV